MRITAARVAGTLLLGSGVLAVGSTGACAPRSRLVAPSVSVAPYDTSAGDTLWAVAPPRNETGTTVLDVRGVGDAIVEAADGVRGIRCLPLNRTVGAMRALGVDVVDDPETARRLAREMGVDAVVLSSVTAYDPYDPPTLGLTLALFTDVGGGPDPESQLADPFRWQLQATDAAVGPQPFADGPESTAGGVFDARSHEVLLSVQRFAEGRTEPDGPFGWRAFVVSMDLYTDFVAHEAVGGLVGQEWLRLSRTRAEN